MIWKIIKFIPLVLFLILITFLYKGIYLEKDKIPSTLIGRSFPSFSLPSLYGNGTITEKDIKGPALVNIWATWCPNCYDEHTYLNKLSEQGIKIYGINYKDKKEDAIHWLEDMKNPYVLNIVDKEGKLGIDLGVYGAPETYIIDKNGVIRYKHIGEVDSKIWNEKIEPIYKEIIKDKSK